MRLLHRQTHALFPAGATALATLDEMSSPLGEGRLCLYARRRGVKTLEKRRNRWSYLLCPAFECSSAEKVHDSQHPDKFRICQNKPPLLRPSPSDAWQIAHLFLLILPSLASVSRRATSEAES